MIVLYLLQDVGQVTTLCPLLRFLLLPQIFLPIIVDFVLADEVQIEQLLVLLFSGELLLIDGRFGVSVHIGEIDKVISALLYVLLTKFDDRGLAIFVDMIDMVLVQIFLLTSWNITGSPDFLSLEKDALAPVDCHQSLLEHRFVGPKIEFTLLALLLCPSCRIGDRIALP